MAKVRKLEKLNGTFVFDVASETPIRPSMLGKIRKSELCDNLDVRSEYNIRITKTVKDGEAQGNYPVEEFEMENGWGEVMAELIQKDLEKVLHSCSRFLKVKKVHIFLT